MIMYCTNRGSLSYLHLWGNVSTVSLNHIEGKQKSPQNINIIVKKTRFQLKSEQLVLFLKGDYISLYKNQFCPNL